MRSDTNAAFKPTVGALLFHAAFMVLGIVVLLGSLLSEHISVAGVIGGPVFAAVVASQLNLVLNDGERINVIDHGDLNAVRQDAQTLARLMHVPLWDPS
jgi:hypothetical protein